MAVGLTALAVLFPPFTVNGGPYEFGFIFAVPPSAARAMAAMSALGGRQGADLAAGLIHYAVDVPRLVFELAVVWCAFAALRWTVLRGTSLDITNIKTGHMS